MTEFMKNLHGSKKGFLNYLKYGIYQQVGIYRKFTKIDISKVDRFVFVCSGNICRSPLAENVMSAMGGKTVSFGLDTRGGDRADQRMIEFGKENGFDLSKHITQKIIHYIPCEQDLLIGMEPSHLNKLHKLFPNSQITSLGFWLSPKKIYIHDPYSANKVYFTNCAEEIVTATKKLYHDWCNACSE